MLRKVIMFSRLRLKNKMILAFKILYSFGDSRYYYNETSLLSATMKRPRLFPSKILMCLKPKEMKIYYLYKHFPKIVVSVPMRFIMCIKNDIIM